MIISKINENEVIERGKTLGSFLEGGEIIELIGDVGAGKTTFTKGIAEGLGIKTQIQSPSFTICRQYNARNGLLLAHYDFYRLDAAGIMANELDESINDPKTITIIEWGGIASDVLPDDRLIIKINTVDEELREIIINAGGEKNKLLLEKIS